MFRRSPTMPPASSVRRTSIPRTRVALSKPAARMKVSSGPSSRTRRMSAEPEPSASCAVPFTDSRAARPNTGSAISTSSMAISPISMLTGSSGRAKGVASGAGRSDPSGGRGGRRRTRRSAVSQFTSSAPERTPARRQLSRAFFEDQPFAVGVGNAQPIKLGLGRQGAAEPVDAHLSVVAIRKLRFEEPDQATAVVVLRGERRAAIMARRRLRGGDGASECLPDADVEEDVLTHACRRARGWRGPRGSGRRACHSAPRSRASVPVAVLKPGIGPDIARIGEQDEAEISIAKGLPNLGRQRPEAAPPGWNAVLDRAERLVFLPPNRAGAAGIEQVVGRDQIDIAAEQDPSLRASRPERCGRLPRSRDSRARPRSSAPHAVAERHEGRAVPIM
jgi:hypothetical protein